MHTRRLALATTLIALAAALSGCAGSRHSASFSSSSSSNFSSSAGAPFAVDPRCRNGSACLYNGHYNPGEREYAEKEARRLNEAEYQRLVHSSW